MQNQIWKPLEQITKSALPISTKRGKIRLIIKKRMNKGHVTKKEIIEIMQSRHIIDPEDTLHVLYTLKEEGLINIDGENIIPKREFLE